MRLTNHAFEIMRAEVSKCAHQAQSLGQVQQQIVLKRLERLRLQQGNLATLEDLRETVKDIFPDFSETVLKEAAKANLPTGVFSKIKWGIMAVGGAVGFIWLVNLPYPMIRWPVAKTVPILLLPSFMSMDHNYRQALALVEKADQLINKATASPDLDLGEETAKQAQKHLDALPVWFLGYYPQRYCSFFTCSWRFTYDEFEQARKDIGRMQATIFQEKNAQIQLKQGEIALQTAQDQFTYSQLASEKKEALINWQKSLEKLEQISPATLAGKMVQTKLSTAKNDFAKVSGSLEEIEQSNNLIEASKQFAWQAAKASQNAPHPESTWEQVVELWEKAITRLERVSENNPGYVDAQKRLAQYQANLGAVKIKLTEEKESTEALKQAKRDINEWQKQAKNSPNRSDLIGNLQAIINQLETVKSGTTAYIEARQLLEFARKAQKQI